MTIGYRLTDWQGYTRYECAHCGIGMLQLPQMEEHIYRRHGVWPGDPDVVEDAPDPVQDLIDDNRLDDLREVAALAGLDQSGTKRELATRILGKEQDHGD